MKLTEQEIINYYIDNAPMSISEMSRKFENTYKEINKTLRINNIEIKGGRKRKELTVKQLDILRIKYCENSESIHSLSKYFKLSRETLSKIILSNNFQKKTNNVVNKNIKSDYFSIIDTPTKAYWIGLLFADGSVDRQGGGYRIRLFLQERDLELIEKFRKDLNVDCKIVRDNRKNSGYSIEFLDKQIFEDLSVFGIIPNKTYKTEGLKYDKIPNEYLRDYARGLFDGDGCITYDDIKYDVTLGFASYYEQTIKDIQMLVDNMINKEFHNKIFKTNCWHCQWRGRQQALLILSLLYDGSERYLNRKYLKYLNLK